MHHPPLDHVVAVALWILAADAGAGESTARVIYPVDYTAKRFGCSRRSNGP